MKPRLLDLFCGAGGASVGYHRAGFDVVGVDINPQPRYPFEFVQGDALAFADIWGHEFDVIHASPPCQRYSTMTAQADKHPDLVGPVRDLLIATRRHYVIENVPQAPLVDPVILCGSAFGLRVRRHRAFESNLPIVGTDCYHAEQGRPVGVYGQHPDRRQYFRPDGTQRGTKATTLGHARRAMGIDWMEWPELAESIPPAYTEYIGGQLLADPIVRAGTDAPAPPRAVEQQEWRRPSPPAPRPARCSDEAPAPS